MDFVPTSLARYVRYGYPASALVSNANPNKLAARKRTLYVSMKLPGARPFGRVISFTLQPPCVVRVSLVPIESFWILPGTCQS